MLQKAENPLRIAVVEDVFSHKDYKGEEKIEYCITPYTASDELENTLEELSPDLVIISEAYQKLAPALKNKHTLLLAADKVDVQKFRRALSLGMKGAVIKPVTYEKVALALKGRMPRDHLSKENIIYFGASCDQLPRVKKPKIKIDLPAVEEIRREIKPVILMQKEEKGKIITFFNTKGGVGKTLFSANLAVYTARMYPSKRIALLDFDLDFGDIANLLGIEPRITALSWQYIPEDSLKQADIENYLIKHPTGVYVLPAPIPPVDEEIFTYKIAHRILSTLKKHFDLVVVDLGPTLRDVVVVTIEHADKIFLVSTAGISSLRNIYDLVRIFDGLKIEQEKIYLLLNSLKKNMDINELKKYIPYKVALKVPYIKQVEIFNDSSELVYDDKRFRIYLEDLSLKILGKEPEKKGFFAFLRR